MKRLFKVVTKNGTMYFEDKVLAKKYRDTYPYSHVSRGPDHIGKHGVFSKQRQNKV